jgi:hypothetical protein
VNEIAKQMKLRQWASDLEDWRQSGLTQTAWIKIRGISRDTWKYRKRQVEKHMELLMREDLVPYEQTATRLPEPQQIVPLACSPDAYGSIEIDLPGGRIRMTGNVSSELLQAAIREVKNA